MDDDGSPATVVKNDDEGSALEEAETPRDQSSLEEYYYDSPHDTPQYVRSLAKAFGALEDRPPSALVAMAIGVPDYPNLLTTPPFSDISSKAVQETYVPISELLKREVLRRSHFLLSEIDNKRTDHPLRDGSMRLRMPQPAQWNRDKLLKFLEEKVFDLHEKDLEFLRTKVGEVKVEISHHVRLVKARREAEAKQAAERGASHSRRRKSLEALPIASASGVEPSGANDTAVGLLLSAAGRGSAEGASTSLVAGSSSGEADAWTERITKRLYGAANGLETIEGLSESDAFDTLDFVLNHRPEALQFLQVGRAYYQSNAGTVPQEVLDKAVGDLARYSQRKRAKLSQVASL